MLNGTLREILQLLPSSKMNLLFGHSAAHSYQLPVDEPDGAAHRHGIVRRLLADLVVLRGERGHPRVDVDQIRRRDASPQVPLRTRRHHQRQVV